LEATLTGPPPPVMRSLAADPAELLTRAEGLVAGLARAGIDARAVPTEGAAGGGGAPGVPLPSAAVSVPETLTVPLRTGPAVQAGQLPAVVGRVEGGRLLLDLLA